MATRCGACKLIRRKCKDDCVFAPFFPSDQIDKFSCLHSVFGSRYVSKCLTKLPFNQREAEVNSLVFQAKARREDPVYGSAGLISRQQQQLLQLQQEVDFLMKRLQPPQLPQMQLQQPQLPQMQLQQPHFSQTQLLQQLQLPQMQLQQPHFSQTQFLQQLQLPQMQLQQPHFPQTQLQQPHFPQTQLQQPHFPQRQLQPQLPQMQLQQLHFPQTQLQQQHFPQTQLLQPHFPQRKRKTSRSTRAAKKKKKATTNTSDEVLSLPYDLLVMIVARVPILYYRNLSLVSKSFQSMVASTELYRVRSDLGLTESCLYVCMRFGFSSHKWYTLSSKSKSSSSGRGSGYVLGKVSIMPPGDGDDSPCAVGSGISDIVAVGSDIYNIGQAADKTGVSILDCKTHRWRKAPSMPVEVESISARVLDQKIYVLGRRYHNQDGSWKSLLQVFNTSTQTWDDIPWCVLDLARHTFNIDGNIHAIDIFGKVFAFNSKQGRWDLVEQYPRVCESMFSGSYCEIDNVLYSVSKEGALRWYDTDKTRWRDLKGLVGLPKLPSYGAYVKLTGYGGGKMMLFWNINFNIHLSQEETIYCAEIALERRNGDCWGKLEWYDGVHSVLAGTEIVKVLSVTL
ncbi:unnamed protein product [Eruca vesicaria subsp. sativa]|uniref:F-box domain-containing protein n=1 Tax=Eruca vesicaria subsp. sativa TaxID=29727 RepID=A0ABC8JT94_ERUVS|nr:unnamed protein product [Eruca vesicaria subsp. sativa]